MTSLREALATRESIHGKVLTRRPLSCTKMTRRKFIKELRDDFVSSFLCVKNYWLIVMFSMTVFNNGSIE